MNAYKVCKVGTNPACAATVSALTHNSLCSVDFKQKASSSSTFRLLASTCRYASYYDMLSLQLRAVTAKSDLSCADFGAVHWSVYRTDPPCMLITSTPVL